MKTDTTEKGLEKLIVDELTSAGWIAGHPEDYNRNHAVDLTQLTEFLRDTQPLRVEELELESDSPKRLAFLARLQGEVTRRGVIDVLRHGLKHGPHSIDLFYGTPTPGNRKAEERYATNRFSVARQVRYSLSNENALDACLFINGLPVATFELKNSLTKQTAADAVEQYRKDRDPGELLFAFGRCIAHFAVDDSEVQFCPELKGKASWFLPFNKGWNQGAGNPPNPDGLKTDYLWKDVLSKRSLTNIIEKYAQIVEETNKKIGKKKRVQIFPRYHQLDVVRKLLADTSEKGAGERYLIQHSAGSGKSNSIAWLAHQLTGIDKGGKPAFDTIIVVTDRRVLDGQIRATIKQFDHVGATVGAVTEGAQQLRQFITEGKRVIISTVQKFPFILEEIGNEHRGRTFGIIIDEAHSSQGGKTAGALNKALADTDDDSEDIEDIINREMEGRQLLKNASYFAFTATPKAKTLEIFGTPYMDGGEKKFKPFHSYAMKQAIEEGFIQDVLQNYTTVDSYYKLVKTVESDPEFDTKRAKKKLRHYVEGHAHAIGVKAEIMADHFHEQVIARKLVGGEARAMVVTGGVDRAIEYFQAFDRYLKEIKSPYKAIVAFSGEREWKGQKVSEASLNKFPSNDIADKIQEDPYRFLICADKFQTGYDEPLLHTMYVDKPLAGVKAVQTLSRLNRAHPKKHDTFVLDFQNSVETIQKAFEPYYRTTILSKETDPNKLHDLKAALDGYQVYAQSQVDDLAEKYLKGASREQLDPILDDCVAVYLRDLDEDGQVEFKGKAKAFVRTYNFLSTILPYTNAGWEKLSIFLSFLISKLPAPKEEDFSKGILDTIDMDSYRLEKQAAVRIQLPDQDAEIEPAPADAGGRKPDPEIDFLSNILNDFNEQFGNIAWEDKDRVRRMITEEIPAKVAADRAYQNAMQNSDRQNAKIEHEKALGRVMAALLNDDTQLFSKFQDDPNFKKWLTDKMFAMTYEREKTASNPVAK